MSRVSVHPRQAHERCALCHEPLGQRLKAQRCRGCQTGFHAACSRELGGCPTLGCTTRDSGTPRDEAPSWLEAFDLAPREDARTARGARGPASPDEVPTWLDSFDAVRPEDAPAGAASELWEQFSPAHFAVSGLLAVVVLGKTLWDLPHGVIGSLALALAFAVWVGFEKERAIGGPLQFWSGAAKKRRGRYWLW